MKIGFALIVTSFLMTTFIAASHAEEISNENTISSEFLFAYDDQQCETVHDQGQYTYLIYIGGGEPRCASIKYFQQNSIANINQITFPYDNDFCTTVKPMSNLGQVKTYLIVTYDGYRCATLGYIHMMLQTNSYYCPYSNYYGYGCYSSSSGELGTDNSTKKEVHQEEQQKSIPSIEATVP